MKNVVILAQVALLIQILSPVAHAKSSKKWKRVVISFNEEDLRKNRTINSDDSEQAAIELLQMERERRIQEDMRAPVDN